jgi:hypothetical protein
MRVARWRGGRAQATRIANRPVSPLPTGRHEPSFSDAHHFFSTCEGSIGAYPAGELAQNKLLGQTADYM